MRTINALCVILLTSSILGVNSQGIQKLKLDTGVDAVGKSITNIKWTDCDGTGTPYIELTKLELAGNLFVGGSIEIIASGNVKQTFFATSFDAVISVNGQKVSSSNYPIPNAKPSYPGVSSIDTKEPIIIPPPVGNYSVVARLKDSKGNELQCFLVNFVIQ